MLCSVVLPVYNEEENIRQIHDCLRGVLQPSGMDYEVIFVDDGSTDGSLEIIKQLAVHEKNVFYIAFTRNFGHEAASTAGLDTARGDFVILMDADMQDPPELIPGMISLWQNGYQVVYAKRRKRHGETFLKRFMAGLFYRFLNLLSEQKIPIDTGDFRLMDRVVVEDFKKCREYNRFVRGLTAWVGYNQIAIEFDRNARLSGQTKYNFLRLLMLSLDVVTSYSIIPLRIITVMGVIIASLSFCESLYIIWYKFFVGVDKGYALLATGMFFLGGVQIISLGIIGEYVGKIYRQVQQRPLYLIKDSKLL